MPRPGRDAARQVALARPDLDDRIVTPYACQPDHLVEKVFVLQKVLAKTFLQHAATFSAMREYAFASGPEKRPFRA